MLKFERSKPEKAAQVIAKQIRQAILNGDLNVGDKLPAERDLIEQVGYSRSVVREALRLLEDDGLIVTRAGRNGGAVVTNPDPGQLMSSIDTLLRIQQTNIKEVHDVQRLIEPIIVKRAIENATQEDFARLRESIALIEENPSDIDIVLAQSNQFHVLLGEATKNNVLAIIATLIRRIVIDFHYQGDVDQARSIAKAHGRILDAIVSKDVETAVRRSLRHIDASEDTMCSNAH